MDSDRFSQGSTTSGYFNKNLKTPDPFQFVYTSHPFGPTAITPIDFYDNNYEIFNLSSPLSLHNKSSMNFQCNFMNKFPDFHSPDFNSINKHNDFHNIKSPIYLSTCSNLSTNPFDYQCIQSSKNSSSCEDYLECQKDRTYLQRHIPSQSTIRTASKPIIFEKPNKPNCYDETNVPELKFIFQTLRNVWKTPIPLDNTKDNRKCRKFCCQNLPHKRQLYIDQHAVLNLTPNSRLNLVRRYSLPEIEIRKFGIGEELDKIFRFTEALKSKSKLKLPPLQSKQISVAKTTEKASQTNTVKISEYSDPQNTFENQKLKLEFTDTAPTYLDLVSNNRNVNLKLVKKPETMPFAGYQTESCGKEFSTSKSFKDIEENLVKIKSISTIETLNQDAIPTLPLIAKDNADDKISNKKSNHNLNKNLKVESKSGDSDVFVSELLIKNLNEETHIADILQQVLTEGNNIRKIIIPSPLLTPKIEISTIYVSPEKINDIVEKNINSDTNKNIFKQTLQLPDICLLETFEKLPPICTNRDFNISNIQNDIIVANNNGKSNTIKSNNNSGNESKKSSEISSSNTLYDTFDTPSFAQSVEQESPIDSLEQKVEKKENRNGYSSSNEPQNSSSSNYTKPCNVAEIQPIKSIDKVDVAKNKTLTLVPGKPQSPFSQSKRKVILPLNKKLNCPTLNDKGIINSLDQFTIDSRGNPKFQKLIKDTKNVHHNLPGSKSSTINSRYLRVSASSSTSRNSLSKTDKMKKVTIFEAQSNMVTPDNDMGPKRFYQKTEIFDGDKKIDILEIVECLQTPFTAEHKISGDFNTKFSKIPVPISRKCCKSIQVPFLKHCSSPFNSLSPNMIRSNLQFTPKTNLNTDEDSRIFHEYMLNESLGNKRTLDMKPLSKVPPLFSNNNELKNKNKKQNESERIKTIEFSSESGGLKTSEKTSNTCDKISTTNDAYKISIPSTTTAKHGSTSRQMSSSRNRLHLTNSNPKSTSNISKLLHSRSKKTSFRKSARLQKRLLSNRKQHQNHIIEVEPAKNIDCCNFKRSSTQVDMNQNDDKLNAWRIPSSDFYKIAKKESTENQKKFSNNNFKSSSQQCDLTKYARTLFESKHDDLKFTPSSKCPTESMISTTTICEKCRVCSCYSSTTYSDHLICSPTISLCSICSQPFTPLTRTPKTPSVACLDINCSNYIIRRNCSQNNKLNCRSNVCIPSVPSQRTESSYNTGINCNCPPSLFPKLMSNECSQIPENYCDGYLAKNSSKLCQGKEKPLDRYITSSSSFTSSFWKSGRSHTAMPCINMNSILDKKRKPEVKIEPVKLNTIDDTESNNSVFTVTVKGPKFERGTDLKMELSFFNPNKENVKSSTDFAIETDGQSTCSFETIHERMLPEGLQKDVFSSRQTKTATETPCRLDENMDSKYNLNLSNLLNTKYKSTNNNDNSEGNTKLSVLGNAIAPEQKPKPPTMTEKDLTGRYRK